MCLRHLKPKRLKPKFFSTATQPNKPGNGNDQNDSGNGIFGGGNDNSETGQGSFNFGPGNGMGENGQGGFGFGGGAGTGEAVECEDILMVPGGKVDYNILFN